MTKEEYERLLQSDYWKGYSYSLIKERNFTCEDCGRSFPNERNKLQVHHVVYRDIYPWSYKPEEVVVLCKECHQRRHGIIPENEPADELLPPNADNYTRSYSSEYNVSERNVRKNTSRNPVFYPKKKRRRRAFLVFACILAAILVLDNTQKKSLEDNKISSKSEQTKATNSQRNTRNASPVTSRQDGSSSKNYSNLKTPAQDDAVKNELAAETMKRTDNNEAMEEVVSPMQSSPSESSVQQSELSILDEIIEVEGDSQPQQAGVSTEETTLEMMERINHANIVKQAQRAGVSTEGTTLEIMERINRANIVKQAQRAGVSTEGSTLEIMERINHANIVKQAQRAGVSTEGSTLEIMERINHANIVKQAQRAGVSTEGTTLEIMERINKKNLEKYDD